MIQDDVEYMQIVSESNKIYQLKKTSTMIKFVIHKSKNGQYYFTIVARNGKKLATSETYKRKAGAVNAIGSISSVNFWTVPTIDKTKK